MTHDQPPARDPVLRLSEEEHVQVDQVWTSLSQRVDAGELTLTLPAGEVRLLLAERAERQQWQPIETPSSPSVPSGGDSGQPASPEPTLRGLIDRWRDTVVRLSFPRLGAYWGGHSKALTLCADELEAALASVSPPPQEGK